MAVTPNTDAAFLREVDEELRRDEMARAWRRYGVAAIGALVLAVLAFGGWLVWQSRSQTSAGEDGEAFSKVFDDIGAGQTDTANAALTKLKTSSVDGYSALARMTEADLLLQKQNMTGAASLFAQVAADPKAAQPLRDLALIRQTTAEYDTIKPEIVISRLRALTAKGSPWLGSAGELVAVAYLRTNQRELAGRLYAQIAQSETVSATMKQRAVQMAGVLGVDAVDQSGGQPGGAEDIKAK